MRRFVGVLIAVMSLAFLTGQSAKRSRKPVKVRSAQEFVLKDADGRDAGRWYIRDGKHPVLEMYYDDGKTVGICLMLDPVKRDASIVAQRPDRGLRMCALGATSEGAGIILINDGNTWQAP